MVSGEEQGGYGQKPSGVDEDDFQKYYQVVKSLVEKGQFKLVILDMFPKEDAASS